MDNEVESGKLSLGEENDWKITGKRNDWKMFGK
jgi:hypothetical protein